MNSSSTQNKNNGQNHLPDINEQLKKDFTLKILTRVLALGIVAIFFVSFFTAIKGNTSKGLFPVLGLSLAIAFAAAVGGGFLGFLFGIPKSLQKNQAVSVPDPSAPKAATTNKIFSSNTNLEEISDWLTKIIVGVSLIQLTKLIEFYNQSCRSLARSFKGYLLPDFGFSYSGSIIIFFTVCGFLIVYLWARVYFLKQLNDLETVVSTVNNVSDTVKKQNNRFEQEKLERKIDDFNRERNKVTVRESTDDVKAVMENAKPGPVTVLNDCQKNRWGSSGTNGAYSLTATVVQDGNDPDLFHVTATVSTTDVAASPIDGKVYFILHDSYFPNSIIITDAVEQRTATCTFDSYEAFTMGAVLNNGAVKLELDLNQAPSVPAEYKYSDKLETIDELKTKLAEIKNQDQ
ncbi:MAG: hypothetical protein QM725_12355 [Lacibacter sp.]